MADIVQSLFGITPEMYQQAQSQRADEMALQFAKLSPFEKANFAIGRGAYQLAGALGAEDPELQRISTRNAIARQIDYTDPASMQQGIQALAQAGDTVGAMQLTDVLRKLQSEQALQFQRMAAGQASLAAANRERVQATPEKIQLAREFALLKGAPGSPEFETEYNAQLTRLTSTDRAAAVPEKVQLARELAALKGAPGSPEYQAEYSAQLARLTSTEKPEAMTPEMRNAAALAALKGAPGSPEYNAEYNTQLSRLTTPTGKGEPTTTALTQARVIALRAGPEGSPEYNRAFDAEYKRLTESRPQVQVTNVMPGDKALADVPAFRSKVQGTIDPQLKTITATDQALQAINDSLATGNFAAYRAAQVQFARAIAGAGDLSQRELKAAGADPSLLGGAADYISTVFSGTPTADTQKKIRDTLNAIRTVARKKAQAEVDTQRRIALRSPGYDAAAVNQALEFSELSGEPAAQAPIYARNRATGERIMSTDGGKTWAPAPR